jgi:probable F420-dependent oxidoreductase
LLCRETRSDHTEVVVRNAKKARRSAARIAVWPIGEENDTAGRLPRTGGCMECGVTLPVAGPLGTTEAVTTLATRAETLGFTSVWVTDHIALPLSIQSPYPYSADRRPNWDSRIPYLDAFTVLTWVAAVTRQVRLGTSVLVLPMRAPLAVAKTVGTLDYLSGGRVILGIGAGWMEEEFALLGQPFRDRGRRAIEAIRVLKACWGPDPVRFDGACYQFAPFAMDPKPPQGAALPVLGGGESDAALRRVAVACDGWHPLGLAPRQVQDGLARLEPLVARAGRSMADLFLTARPGAAVPLTRELASQYETLGVRILVADIRYRELTLAQSLAELERLARELRL